MLINETLPTHRADVSVLFGKYLPRLGIYSDVIAGKTAGEGETELWGGGCAQLVNVSDRLPIKHLQLLFHDIYHLLRARSQRYQAIQVRDLPLVAPWALLLARWKGLPFYYWMSFPLSEGLMELAREKMASAGKAYHFFQYVVGVFSAYLLYRWVLPYADHVFVQSSCMKESLVLKGISHDNMTALPMGVDLEEIRIEGIQPSDDKRLRDRKVLVYLGTLDRLRRVEVLFYALRRVKEHFPEALLVLVGDVERDDPHRQWLINEAERVGIAEDVIWTGWLPKQDAWRYVRAADVGLSTVPRNALFDVSSPTKVVEYLAMGVPVVCNDSPDQAKIIRECGAGLCVPLMPDSFADAIINILKLDVATRHAMIDAGKQYVGQYRSYEVLSRELAQTYEELRRGALPE